MMALSNSSHGEPPEETRSAEKLASIYAAMMEELGVGRKNDLSLDDGCGHKGGSTSSPGHNANFALERPTLGSKGHGGKSAKTTNALKAWNTHTFNDVNPEDSLLDTIASGQLHRLHKQAQNHNQARGGSTLSRGEFHNAIAPIFNTRNVAKPDYLQGTRDPATRTRDKRRNIKVDTVAVMARLRGGPMRSNTASYSTVGNTTLATRYHSSPTGRTLTTKVPINENIRPTQPTSSNFNMSLSSPEDFLAEAGAFQMRQPTLRNTFTVAGNETKSPTLPTHKPHVGKSEVVVPVTTLGARAEEASQAIPDQTRSITVLQAVHVSIAGQTRGTETWDKLGLGLLKLLEKAASNKKITLLELYQKNVKTPVIKEVISRDFSYKAVDKCTLEFTSKTNARLARFTLTFQIPYLPIKIGRLLDNARANAIMIDDSSKSCSSKTTAPVVPDVLICFDDDMPKDDSCRVKSHADDLDGLLWDCKKVAAVLVTELAIQTTMDFMEERANASFLDQVTSRMAGGQAATLNGNDVYSLPGVKIAGQNSTSALLDSVHIDKYGAAQALLSAAIKEQQSFIQMGVELGPFYLREMSRQLVDKAEAQRENVAYLNVNGSKHQDYLLELSQAQSSDAGVGSSRVDTVVAMDYMVHATSEADVIVPSLRITYSVEQLKSFRSLANELELKIPTFILKDVKSSHMLSPPESKLPPKTSLNAKVVSETSAIKGRVCYRGCDHREEGESNISKIIDGRDEEVDINSTPPQPTIATGLSSSRWSKVPVVAKNDVGLHCLISHSDNKGILSRPRDRSSAMVNNASDSTRGILSTESSQMTACAFDKECRLDSVFLRREPLGLSSSIFAIDSSDNRQSPSNTATRRHFKNASTELSRVPLATVKATERRETGSARAGDQKRMSIDSISSSDSFATARSDQTVEQVSDLAKRNTSICNQVECTTIVSAKPAILAGLASSTYADGAAKSMRSQIDVIRNHLGSHQSWRASSRVSPRGGNLFNPSATAKKFTASSSASAAPAFSLPASIFRSPDMMRSNSHVFGTAMAPFAQPPFMLHDPYHNPFITPSSPGAVPVPILKQPNANALAARQPTSSSSLTVHTHSPPQCGQVVHNLNAKSPVFFPSWIEGSNNDTLTVRKPPENDNNLNDPLTEQAQISSKTNVPSVNVGNRRDRTGSTAQMPGSWF